MDKINITFQFITVTHFLFHQIKIPRASLYNALLISQRQRHWHPIRVTYFTVTGFPRPRLEAPIIEYTKYLVDGTRLFARTNVDITRIRVCVRACVRACERVCADNAKCTRVTSNGGTHLSLDGGDIKKTGKTVLCLVLNKARFIRVRAISNFSSVYVN